MLSKFNEKAQKIVAVAESIAFDFGHVSVGSEHLLLSFLNVTATLGVILKTVNVRSPTKQFNKQLANTNAIKEIITIERYILSNDSSMYLNS